MFHLGMWRERMRNALAAMSEGREPTPPPANADEVNDAELPNGIGTPLADAAARSDRLLDEIIELYARLGERSIQWYSSKNTTEAVLRNSYLHPRVHLFEYFQENGDQDRANRLFETAEADMRAAAAPPLIMGAAVYNLACARANQGRLGDAIVALTEALQMRPDMKQAAASDSDLTPLRDDPRFQELVKS
jgi:hypothetical protein